MALDEVDRYVGGKMKKTGSSDCFHFLGEIRKKCHQKGAERKYQKLEKGDGVKWLFQRGNIRTAGQD